MKEKIQGIIGLLIIGFFLFGFGKFIYNRNFADAEFTILKPSQISVPVKGALFWHEAELEHTAGNSMLGAKLTAEESFYIKPLYEDLKKTGMVSEYISTMSDLATEKLIALDAYSGKEPDVWAMARQNNFPYVFKVVISSFSGKNRTSNLERATYRYSLYTTDKKLLWEVESPRLAGFLGGMPDSKNTIADLTKQLKEAKIIN